MKISVLAADNDKLALMSLKFVFEDQQVEFSQATSGEQCISMFKLDSSKYHVVLLDYDMKNSKGEGLNGDQVAREIKRINPKVNVVMLSGMEDDAVVAACLLAGADKFVKKGTDLSELVASVKALGDETSAQSESETEEDRRRKISKTLKMVGKSLGLSRVSDLISKFAIYDEPVLILGESGVGKEGLARAIHENSKRSSKSFVAINCAAFGKELLESELFGHEKGSFTGAVAKKIGLFEQANGGTIFLDEIGDMPLDLQVKILRALQEKTIQPVGGVSKRIDFRVVAATHRDLKLMAEENRFRADLYYRLKYLSISVPPLRFRVEDIEPLVRHFINFMNDRMDLRKTISEIAMWKLKSHDWPGNVRELEATVKRAYALSEEVICLDILESELGATPKNALGVNDVVGEDEVITHEEFTKRVLGQERKLLEAAMKASGNVKSAAAHLLQLNHNSMNYRREAVGLDEKEKEDKGQHMKNKIEEIKANSIAKLEEEAAYFFLRLAETFPDLLIKSEPQSTLEKFIDDSVRASDTLNKHFNHRP